MRRLGITIPGKLPKELSPNFLRAWQWKHTQAIKELREKAYLCAVSARNTWEREYGKSWLPLEKAELEVMLIAPHNPKYDWDAIVAMLKYPVDMLTMPKEATLNNPGKLGAAIIRDDNRQCLTWRAIGWEPGEYAVKLIIKEVK